MPKLPLYAADFEVISGEAGVDIFLKLGALRAVFSLNNRDRLALIAALATPGRNDVSSEVHITTLGLPSYIHELSNETLNCRKVIVGKKDG